MFILSPLIHLLIILLVISRSHVVHPFLVVQIPADGLFNPFLELQARLPAQLALQLARVDGIAHVVALAVGHVGNQVHVLAFLPAQQTVNGPDDHPDDVDVLPLVEAADVVGVGNLPLVENQVDGTGVVLHVQPVAHVLALAVHGQGLAVTDVVDEQRNQFLGELIGAVVVGTVGYDGRHPVSVVEGTDKVVRACLRR